MNKRMIFVAFMLVIAIVLLTGCGSDNAEQDQEDNMEITTEDQTKDEGQPVLGPKNEKIMIDMINSDGETIGSATLSQKSDGVLIHLKASDLPPGTHGFHFHEKGICEPPDFETAGGHFNPFEKEHGLDNPKGPHAGDMPNIEVGENRTVDIEILNPRVTLKKGEPNSLLKPGGTALMIHEKADDMVSQPSGDAGARLACGQIID